MEKDVVGCSDQVSAGRHSAECCRNGRFPSGAVARMLSGMPVISMAEVCLEAWILLQHCWYFTTIPVAIEFSWLRMLY